MFFISFAFPFFFTSIELNCICTSPNTKYRFIRKHAFPAQLVDVKRAIAFVRKLAPNYGGDSAFIAATGGSAGGHLSSLCALTNNAYKEVLQPGFEEQDCTLQAVAPFYSPVEFLFLFSYLFLKNEQNRKEENNKTAHKNQKSKTYFGRDESDPDAQLQQWLEKYFIKSSQKESPLSHLLVDPVRLVQEGAIDVSQIPPFFVVHGVADSLVPIDQFPSLSTHCVTRKLSVSKSLLTARIMALTWFKHQQQ